MESFPNPITDKRFCIFCGQPPVKKDLEHVLPQWLLEQTGDPNRVVNLGLNPETRQPISFAFDQFRFPACYDCNQEHSHREGKVQNVINGLLKYEPRPASEYVLLLDWLDKVRIGLWLGNRFLSKNAFGINPKFAINQRLGIKDRMLALYHLDSDETGLSIWGTETPLFSFVPSAFALRINHLLFLNASWDFFCSSRCGFPFPRTRTVLLDKGGLVEGKDFKTRNKVTHPIVKGLYKPVVLFLQPILQEDIKVYSDTGSWSQGHHFMLQHIWPGQTKQGCLFRQYSSKTIPIDDPHKLIEFDDVTMQEAHTLKDISILTYQLQNQSVEWVQAKSSDPSKVNEHSDTFKSLIKINQRIIHKRQSMTFDQYYSLFKKQSPKSLETTRNKIIAHN